MGISIYNKRFLQASCTFYVSGVLVVDCKKPVHCSIGELGNHRMAHTAGSGGKKRSPLSILSSFLFYLLLIVVLALAFAYSQGPSNGKEIAGYRFYTVLTGSMESVIPQGSLVVVKEVDPKTLSVGQDITFYKDAQTVVTHRIEAITPTEENQLLFTTKGVNNTRQDPDPVLDKNVVGRVLFHIPVMGKAFAFVVRNVFWVAGATALLMLIAFALRLLLAKDEPIEEDDEPQRCSIPPLDFSTK